MSMLQIEINDSLEIDTLVSNSLSEYAAGCTCTCSCCCCA